MYDDFNLLKVITDDEFERTSFFLFQPFSCEGQQCGGRLRDLIFFLRSNVPHPSASHRHTRGTRDILARQRPDTILRPPADGRVLSAEPRHTQSPFDPLRRVEVHLRDVEQRATRFAGRRVKLLTNPRQDFGVKLPCDKG